MSFSIFHTKITLIRIPLVCIFLLTCPLYASENKIITQVIDDKIIPVIVINEQPVIEIEHKGTHISRFERAKTFLSNLNESQNNGLDIDLIQVRKIKGNYVGIIGTKAIFTITNGDTLSQNLSARKLALKWKNSIKKAATSPIQKTASQLDLLSSTLEEKSSASSAKTTEELFPLSSIFYQVSVINWGYIIFFTVLLLFMQYFTIRITSKLYRREFEEKEAFLKACLSKSTEIQKTLSILLSNIHHFTQEVYSKHARDTSSPKNSDHLYREIQSKMDELSHIKATIEQEQAQLKKS